MDWHSGNNHASNYMVKVNIRNSSVSIVNLEQVKDQGKNIHLALYK